MAEAVSRPLHILPLKGPGTSPAGQHHHRTLIPPDFACTSKSSAQLKHSCSSLAPLYTFAWARALLAHRSAEHTSSLRTDQSIPSRCLCKTCLLPRPIDLYYTWVRSFAGECVPHGCHASKSVCLTGAMRAKVCASRVPCEQKCVPHGCHASKSVCLTGAMRAKVCASRVPCEQKCVPHGCHAS